MARALAFLRVTNDTGIVQGSKAITFREEDDSTAFASNLYAARSGGAPIVTLNTDAEGYAKVFVDLENARPFNWRVAGDAAGVLDQFIPDPRDLVNLTTAQNITGVKTLASPILQTPAFSGIATGFQTASVLDAAGAVALRFTGTVDTAVAGTWTATNGLTTVTANSNQLANIRRWVAVKIGAQTFTVQSVTFAAGTTTVTLDAAYTGVTGTVTLLRDQDAALEVKTGHAKSLFKVSTNGDVTIGYNAGIPAGHSQDDSDDGVNACDFWYDAVHRRIHMRTLILTEFGDPVDVAIRHGGDGGYPDTQTQSADTANLGAIYWQGTTDTLDFNGRNAMIYVRAVGATTNTNSAGRLVFQTTQPATIRRQDVMALEADGYLSMYRLTAVDDSVGPYLVLRIDSGSNLDIGRDDTINVIQLYGPVDFYHSVATPGTALRVNSGAGVLLPALDPPDAGYATRRSILHVVGNITWSAGVPALAGDYNCVSVTDNGVGDATVTIDRDFSDVNYALVHACFDSGNRFQSSTLNKAVGTFRIQTVASGGDVLNDLNGASNSLDFIASGVQ